MRFSGDYTQPLISGLIEIKNALIRAGGDSGDSAEKKPVDLNLIKGPEINLKLKVGKNVWYERIPAKQPALEADLADTISSLSVWLEDSVKNPSIQVRLLPTDDSFLIQGQYPSVLLTGNIGLDRGVLTFMQNDFDIQSGTISFKQNMRADVSALARTRVRTSSRNPVSGRTENQTFRIEVKANPLNESELREFGLEKSFLNFRLTFDSEPSLVVNDPVRNHAAIMNLLVLGDPLLGVEDPLVTGSAVDGSQLGNIQLGRLANNEIRKLIARFSEKGFKLLGGRVLDYFRLVPRFQYQRGVGSNTGVNLTQQEASDSARESGFAFSDLMIDVGKSFYDDWFVSGQYIWFRDENEAYQNAKSGLIDQEVRPWGGRLGLEYRINKNRILEMSYNYSVDENMEPVVFDRDNIWQAHSFYMGLRNSVYMKSYSAREKRRRWWDEKITAEKQE